MKIEGNRQLLLEKVVFIILLILLIADRLIILSSFAFKYIDADQSVMWYGVHEFMHGRFHEPCYFGQAYNTMLEALFAIPFVAIGMSINKALPLVTSILTLFPFILFSTLSFRQGKKLIAFLILCLPVLLPVEYGMITTMPRGFVGGIFFSSIAVALLLWKNKRWSYGLSALLSLLAFIVNPNSLLITFPLYIYLFIKNYKNSSWYVFSVLGAFPAFIIYFQAKHFYNVHPKYIALPEWPFRYSWKLLHDSLTYTDPYFNNLTPIFWSSGWVVLVIICVCIFILFRQKSYAKAWAALAGVLFILFSFGVYKTTDGTFSLFFPYARFYLAIPVGIAVLIYSIKMSSIRLGYYIIPILLSVSMFYVKAKTSNIDELVIMNSKPQIDCVLDVKKVADLENLCNSLNRITDSTKATLLIVRSNWFISYICPALLKKFPETLLPEYDRRTWRLLEEDTLIRKNILVLDDDRGFWEKNLKEISNLMVINLPVGIYLLQNNTMKTKDVLKEFGIKQRIY
jgi:hypothetical protein